MKKIFVLWLSFLMVSFVVASGSGTLYSSLMQDLDTAHRKIITTVNQQEKKVTTDFLKLQTALEKDYSYMSLHCLDILHIHYSWNALDTKDILFKDLLDFNHDIYAYKLGIKTDYTAIKNRLQAFSRSGISDKTQNIFTHYEHYKKSLLADIKTYVQKNQDLILPLVNKMKFIDDSKQKFDTLKKLTDTTYSQLFTDTLLKKISLLQKNFREILAKQFDTNVVSHLTAKSWMRIAKIKKDYLAQYDRDFRELYHIVLWVSLYAIDDDQVQAVLQKYYTDDTYQCHSLLADEQQFPFLKMKILAQLEKEGTELAAFITGVKKYRAMTVAWQNTLKIKMIQQLKTLIDDYMGAKLRAVLQTV